MYIKFSVVRNIFKLTSHRPPSPVFIQLWYVMLTASPPSWSEAGSSEAEAWRLHSRLLGGSSHGTCVLAHATLLVRKGLFETLGSDRACAVCSGWDDSTSEETALRRSSWFHGGHINRKVLEEGTCACASESSL